MKEQTPPMYLAKLQIVNFAIFDNQEISFDPKFNAIIGETGSGKSLILDALQLIFGNRAEKKLIRKNKDFASVEAIFRCNDPVIKSYLNEQGYPFNDEIIIKRVIYKNNNSRTFLNLSTCSLQVLNSFSCKFIDLVGQFENQKLLSEEYQLYLLDLYGQNKDLLKKYSTLFSELQSKESKLSKLNSLAKSKEREEDFLKFQLNEINEVNPSINIEKSLLKEKESIISLESQNELIKDSLNLISNFDTNIVSQIKGLIKIISTGNFDSSINIDLIHEALLNFEDLSYTLSNKLNESDDESRITEILNKLDSYQKIKRKYGPTLNEVCNHRDQVEKQIFEYSEIDSTITLLTKEVSELKIKALRQAELLHSQRKKHAIKLSQKLTASIQSLNMIGATINIDLGKTEKLNESGCSCVNFLAETNPGEGMYKIKDIASGGELSRILLSLRRILSSLDSISVFLFDEIDAGIGGETALKIGNSLKDVSESSQVIAITHLPQVAFYADKLIEVNKFQQLVDGENRTYAEIFNYQDQAKESKVQNMNPLH